VLNVKIKTRSEFIICLFLVLTILAAYWQLPLHDFLVFDDNKYIAQNTHVHEGITWKNIAWAFSNTDFGYWHPLTWLSHMLVFQLVGLKFGMHHLTNLFFHIANTLLLFLVFKRMTGTLWQSAFVAAMFALHPLNVESVAWASERKNVLSTFFWMLTIWTYIRYTECPGFYRYLLILFVFVLGLMAKPMLVTLPFVLLLLDYWPLCRLNLTRLRSDNQEIHTSKITGFQTSPLLHLILEKIPLLGLSAICIYLSSLSIQRFGIVISTASVPMRLRIGNALVSYVIYIKKMVWPHNLAVFYPYPKTLPLWQVYGAGLLLVCISILSLRAAKSKPYLVVGWLWFIGTLVPVIGLVQAGLWPATADRFAYVPLIGLFMVIAWGVPDLVFRWRRRKAGLAVIAATFFPILMATTWLQIRHWQNGVTLFTHNLNVTHNNSLAYNELGNALKQEGKFGKAMFYYSKALQINPNYAEAHNNLGYTLTQQKNYQDAIYHYNKALRIKPTYAEAHNNLGTALLYQGNDKGAIYHYNEALKSNPNYAGVYYNLGKIYLNQGKIEKAILLYRKALELNPEMTQVLYNLSWVLASHKDEKYRNGEEAVKLAEMLCKVTRYNQPLALDALASAYAETKRFDAAVLTAKKALKLALLYGPQELALGLKKRLQLYQAELPYRQNFRE
jgi:Flp pilus assembly protein TadD